MRSIAAVLLLVLPAAGCRAEPPEAPGVVIAWDVAPANAQGFVLLHGEDTLAVERFVREDTTVTGELTDHAEGTRVHYLAVTTADELVSRLELEAYARGGTEPEHRATAYFRADSIIAEERSDGDVHRQATGAPAGTVAYLSPSVALMEQLLRRARHLGGTEVQVPMLIVIGGAPPLMVNPTVTWQGDSVFVFVDPNNQFRGRVDAQGRILGGTNPAQAVHVLRL